MEVSHGNKARRNSIAMVTPITRTPGICRSHFPAALTPSTSRSEDVPMFNNSPTPCSSISSSPVSSSPPRSSSPDDKGYDLCSRSLNISSRVRHHSNYHSDHHDQEQPEDDDLPPDPGMRPRTYSLPATHARMLRPAENGSNVWRDVYTCPVRSFSRTTKGVVNKGDSVRKCSISSILSSSSTVTDTEERVRTMSIASQDSIGVGFCGGVGIDGGAGGAVGQVAPSYYKVALLGTIGVGKSALCRQFMSSEYLGTYENSCDGEEGPSIVSVMLDGEESMIEFYEGPTGAFHSTESGLKKVKDLSCLPLHESCRARHPLVSGQPRILTALDTAGGRVVCPLRSPVGTSSSLTDVGLSRLEPVFE
ncbi:hypothetical protein BaRGS_00009933 [Batillaria attramentaria]|uniref:Uncharacterized protein n=1 Tax=Batillaria attramentaria TaxID=370345 RepID=A0ABD0LHY6_9CAEN